MTALVRSDVRLAWGVEPADVALLLRISLPLGATMIVNYLYFRLDVVLLSILQGETEAVAVYGLAYRVLEGLMVLPGLLHARAVPRDRAVDRSSASASTASSPRRCARWRRWRSRSVLIFAVFADGRDRGDRGERSSPTRPGCCASSRSRSASPT